MKFRDYYETLGIARTATQDEVRQAYRKLARKFHPDVSQEANAETRFKELGEAYAVLKSPEKRAAYDLMGSDLKSGQDFQPPPDWDSGFEFHGRDFGGGSAADQEDFFESLFGRRARGGGNRPAHGVAQDHHAKVQIDLEDAYRGCQRSVELRMPTQTADGHVVLQTRTLAVAIPKGIRAGQHLRLAGQGGAAPGGGPAGDLYLEIEFRRHRLFRVEGRDVFLELPVSPWEAALGASVEAPTPDGPVQLKIPPGSQAGKQLRLKGRGIPGTAPGDLYVALTIALPPMAGERERAAYQAMAHAFDFNPRGALQG